MFDYERHQERTDNRQYPLKCCWCFELSLIRFVVLLFVTVTGFLISAVMYFPDALVGLISTSLNIKEYQVDYLNFVYVIPSVLWCMLDGVVIDRWLGLKLGSLIFVSVSFLGELIVTVGGFKRIYWLMLMGRFVSGLGAETLYVCLYCYCVQWFQLHELNFSFGLLRSLTRLGSFFTISISDPFVSYTEKIGSKFEVLGLCMSPFLVMTLLEVLSVAFVVHRTYIHQSSYFSTDNRTIERLVTFSVIFWLLVIMIALCEGPSTSFMLYFNQILKDKYNLSSNEATAFGGFLFLFGGLTAPLPGLLADVFGKNILFSVFGILTGLISQFLLTFTNVTPYVIIVLSSIHFSILYSCSLPLLSYIVDPNQLVTSYGILRSLMYFSSAVSDGLSGYLLDKYGPFVITLYFTVTLLVAFICSLLIYMLDKRSNGMLNMSVLRRRILLQTTQV